MNQRINPDTGYPMSTDKQIKAAREMLAETKKFSNSFDKFLQEVKESYSSKNDLLYNCYDEILFQLTSLPRFEADLYYKTGNWEKAEELYLKIFFLDINIADKLRILYQKEKRYLDSVYVMEFALNAKEISPIPISSFSGWVLEKFNKNLNKAKEKAEKYENRDQSLLKADKQLKIIGQETKVFNLAKGMLNQFNEVMENRKN